MEAKKILLSDINAQVLDCFRQLEKALKMKDADQIRLKKDKLEREEAIKATQKAKEKTGDLQDKIFLEASRKEEDMA
jgi:hypothetical protein